MSGQEKKWFETGANGGYVNTHGMPDPVRQAAEKQVKAGKDSTNRT